MAEISRNETLAVSTASVQLAQDREGHGGRKLITIRNISPNAIDTVTVAFSKNVAVANNGVVLRQNESLTDANDGTYICWQNEIQIICATINGLVAIFER